MLGADLFSAKMLVQRCKRPHGHKTFIFNDIILDRLKSRIDQKQGHGFFCAANSSQCHCMRHSTWYLLHPCRQGGAKRRDWVTRLLLTRCRSAPVESPQAIRKAALEPSRIRQTGRATEQDRHQCAPRGWVVIVGDFDAVAQTWWSRNGCTGIPREDQLPTADARLRFPRRQKTLSGSAVGLASR